MSVGSNNFLAAKGILLTMLVLALAACTAGNGEGLDSNGQPNPINPPAASVFQEIQDTVFTPICSQCHIGANAPQGLRLDAANSYAMLVNVPSNEVPALKRVNPGQCRPELHRAEDLGHGRGRWAHAARPGGTAAGSHRSDPQLDRLGRGCRRPAHLTT